MAGLMATAILGTWLPLAAGAGPGQFDDYTGRDLYARFCASCHGGTAHGDGPVAAALSVMVPDLTRLQRAGADFPEQRVRRAIDGRSVHAAHGSRSMPVWGEALVAEEGGDEAAEAAVNRMLDKLVTYLRSIQR